ncbi:MAG: SIR2 family protein, partial [Methanophagales archaeon]|nr:SIR2 family protein [Methanophagales archaeon]
IRLIKENCIINNDKRENIAKIYDELFKIIEKSNSSPITINIFTTNYDLIIEEYFKRKGEELYDGFFFGNQWEPSSDYTGIIPGKKFTLFKLHGSINYYYEGNKIVKRDILFPTKTIDGIELKDSMIYPTREKEVYKDPFFESLTRLKTSLLSEKICIVIGYSFGDEHIRNIFFDAVKRNPKIKILYGDKNLDGVIKNLEQIKDNIIPIEGEFGEEAFFERLEEEFEKCKSKN